MALCSGGACWCAVPVLCCLVAGGTFLEREEWIEGSTAESGSEMIVPRDDPDHRTGWYELPNGQSRLVTWSASGGVLAIDFASLKQERLSDDDAILSGARRSTAPPYSVEEILYSNGDTDLVATLFVPSRSPMHAAIVMIHGSGDSDRDNLWYQLHAHLLAESGIAVLLPDKRGSGLSSGSWKTASFDDFADDAVAAVEWLRDDPRIDPERIGIVGISQGGWIAPLVASKTAVALIINVSGTTVTPMEQLRHETRATLRQKSLPEIFEPVATAIAVGRKPLWWKRNGDFDPIPLWAELSVPSLIVYGSEDEDDNVPVEESVARIHEHLGDSTSLRVEVFPGVGHGLMDPGTGRLLESYLHLFQSFAATHLVKTHASPGPGIDSQENAP